VGKQTIYIYILRQNQQMNQRCTKPQSPHEDTFQYYHFNRWFVDSVLFSTPMKFTSKILSTCSLPLNAASTDSLEQ